MNLPSRYTIEQAFPRDRLEDVPAAVQSTLLDSGVRITSGQQVAIAIGSRGIAHIPEIIRTVAAWVRGQGGSPFIVPAMGSHGAATAEGQQKVLESYGITEAFTSAPIRSSLEVDELPRGDLPAAVYIDRIAHQADAVIVVNRIKPHTSFHGRYESGVMKMIAIGLGKHAQAKAIHQFGLAGLRELMPRVARQVIAHSRIVLGLAIVENAYDETLRVQAMPAARIADEEPALLELARTHMPALPVDRLDLLIVDEMGKDISGLGMDPNIIGRLKIRGEPEPASPDIKLIYVRDLSPGSHGNGVGVGLADFISRRLYEHLDLNTTYENALTSTFTERAKIPMIAAADAEALAFAVRALGDVRPADLHIARIRNTLRLDVLQVSEPLWAALKDRPGITTRQGPRPWLSPSGELQDH